MGDRHPRRYKPDKRHAILAVNSALVIAQFLVETYNYQYNSNSFNPFEKLEV